MATQQIKGILNADIPQPSFVIRPSAPAPLPNDVTFERSTTGQVLSPQSNVEQVASGEPRIRGAQQRLIQQPERTQKHGAPTDSTQWSADGWSAVNTDASSVAGLPATEYVEDTTTGQHYISTNQSNASFNSGQYPSVSFILNTNRRYIRIAIFYLRDSDGDSRIYRWWFDTKNLTVSNTNHGTDSTPVNAHIIKYGEGYRVAGVFKAKDSGVMNRMKINPVDNDTSRTYTGDGTSVTEVAHAQAEEGGSPSSPILSTGKTRNADVFRANPANDLNGKEGTWFIEGFLNFRKVGNRGVKAINMLKFYEGDYSSNGGSFVGDFQMRANRDDYVRFISGSDRIRGSSAPTAPNGFEPFRAAISEVRGEEMRLAVDGQSATLSKSSSSSVLDATHIESGGGGLRRNNLQYSEISYRPEALSVSALETLTA